MCGKKHSVEYCLELARKLHFEYKGINITTGSFFFFWDLQSSSNHVSWRWFLGSLRQYPDVSEIGDAAKKYETVFSYVLKRKDYMDLINKASFSINSNKVIFIGGSKIMKKSNYVNFYLLSKAIRFCVTKRDILKDRKTFLLICSHFYRDMLIVKELFNSVELGKIKNYVPFNSSYPIECIIAQFFNLHGVKTYHLCHTLHFHPDISFYSMVRYNIMAQVVLAWGKAFEKYALKDKWLKPTSFIIAGNPKYPQKEINLKTTFKHCIIFFAAGAFERENTLLLDIILDFKLNNPQISFSIKLHPTSLRLSEFEEICENENIHLIPIETTISECLQSGVYDFSISCQSTTYIEAYYYDVMSFRFAVNESISYGDLPDRFKTKSDLQKLIYIYTNVVDIEELNKTVKTFLEESIGMGINNYGKLFNA